MCPIRFSRASLSSDTSVTTLEFTDDGTDLGIQAVITGTSRRLVQSTSESNLSPDGDCNIDSFEILHGSSWQELDSTGFELSQQGSETHLTVSVYLRAMCIYRFSFHLNHELHFCCSCFTKIRSV